MEMKLSIFTTVTNPTSRGDNWRDAFACYRELADEVVVINGGESLGIIPVTKFSSYKQEDHKWPKEFDWPLIGEQFQRGYEACTGDWVIHADLDFIFHERDFVRIRYLMEQNPKAPALSFWKYQFILPDRYNLKSRLVIAVNKAKYGDRIKFNSGGDLCQPSLDGEEITPNLVQETRIPFYNYEKMTKTYDQVMDDVGRMARAYQRRFKEYKLGRDNEDAFDKWMTMVRGRFGKEQTHIKFNEHPKYVQDTIRSLRPDQFGFNGFGLLGDNDYLKEFINA